MNPASAKPRRSAVTFAGLLLGALAAASAIATEPADGYPPPPGPYRVGPVTAAAPAAPPTTGRAPAPYDATTLFGAANPAPSATLPPRSSANPAPANPTPAPARTPPAPRQAAPAAIFRPAGEPL